MIEPEVQNKTAPVPRHFRCSAKVLYGNADVEGVP